jgi:hypothetical protein
LQKRNFGTQFGVEGDIREELLNVQTSMNIDSVLDSLS